MMNLKMNRKFVMLSGLLLTGVLTVGEANAECPIIAGVPVPTSINVDPTVPVGTTMATTTFSWNTITKAGCSFPETYATYTLNGMGTPTGNLYPTSIPGLAYRGKITGWPSGFLSFWPVTVPNWIVAAKDGVAGGSVIVEFVKTGPLQPGIFAPQVIMVAQIAGRPWFNVQTEGSIIIKPTVPACNTSTPTISVPLNPISPTDLPRVGATAGSKDFAIKLSCGAPANISLNFSGDVVDASQAVFRNTDATTGSSVAVQILKDSNPVPVGAGNNINIGAAVSNEITTQFTARYYAMTNNAQVGDVSSVVTANIVYN
ncbi:fimbrial protein [Serratia fonticola]|uniref:fimbrial protein n=1 Tax=Serratia fonticola TaxID=47917 RepID=UPI001575DA4E|nr:fimbrial protein [Serratia fonticola]NTY86573.1 fimbrial protein [Serratia fonticola]NTZ12458.1 fimbrial protein [Serratia fonticola]CAI1999254.1 fimbrial chaperone protein [Serratia fonticola]CAI2142417.1 fimbrial chaperone protein [Serratia fonticola]